MMQTFIIFGATGDLTGRFLLPAFAHLIQADKLPTPPVIVGVGREPWDRAEFRRHAEEQLVLHSEA
jgi:glucose-6-phosphate 1-dehydrogenase